MLYHVAVLYTVANFYGQRFFSSMFSQHRFTKYVFIDGLVEI